MTITIKFDFDQVSYRISDQMKILYTLPEKYKILSLNMILML